MTEPTLPPDQILISAISLLESNGSVAPEIARSLRAAVADLVAQRDRIDAAQRRDGYALAEVQDRVDLARTEIATAQEAFAKIWPGPEIGHQAARTLRGALVMAANHLATG